MEKNHDSVPVIVFARVPVLGRIKTRIAASAGNQAALEIYRTLLCVTSNTVKNIGHHVAWTGAERPGELEKTFPAALSFFKQNGVTLGVRMRNACRNMFAEGARAAIVIGCDCPYLTGRVLDRAMACISGSADIVLGPADDGGYYLVGCKPGSLGIFDAAGWGTPSLLNETLEITRRERFRHEILERLGDIDTIDDFRAWKG